MSIENNIHCDVCEFIDQGVRSKKTLIDFPEGRPAFPQLIWTFFKKGFSIHKKTDGSEEPVIIDQWQGKPNRLEYCSNHAGEFNVLLKYFCRRDYDILKILEKLKAEDDQEWSDLQDEKTKEFKALHKRWRNKKKVVKLDHADGD